MKKRKMDEKEKEKRKKTKWRQKERKSRKDGKEREIETQKRINKCERRTFCAVWYKLGFMKSFFFYHLGPSTPRLFYSATLQLLSGQCRRLKVQKQMSYEPEKRNLVTHHKTRDVSWLHLSAAHLFEHRGCGEDLQTDL